MKRSIFLLWLLPNIASAQLPSVFDAQSCSEAFRLSEMQHASAHKQERIEIVRLLGKKATQADLQCIARVYESIRPRIQEACLNSGQDLPRAVANMEVQFSRGVAYCLLGG